MTNPPRPGDQAPDNPWQTGGPARQPQPGQQPGQQHPGQQPGQQGQWPHGGSDQGQGQQQSWDQQSWGQQSWSQQPGPYSQTSAGQPHSQTSAGQPHSQTSAGQPYSQTSAGQPYAQSAAGPPPGGGYYQHWQSQPAKRPIGDANPLKAALDFSFDSYATPGLVKIIYILAVVLGAIWWIGGTIVMFVAAASTPEIAGYSSGPSGSDFVPAILSLLLGWIPVLLWLLLVRVLLEAAMALVRTAGDVRALRSDAESDASPT
jgi:hypothetical protein